MAIYKVGSKLDFVKEVPFKFERAIQKLVEAGLKLLFQPEFIRSEFSLNNFRLDSQAFQFHRPEIQFKLVRSSN